jgi:hypothetical protein
MKFWSMNFPPAPVSNQVVVSMISFCPRLSPEINISTVIVSFSIWATCTCSIDIEGEADVEPVLHFKNPPHLYPLSPSLWSFPSAPSWVLWSWYKQTLPGLPSSLMTLLAPMGNLLPYVLSFCSRNISPVSTTFLFPPWLMHQHPLH